MANCWRNLSPESCKECLEEEFLDFLRRGSVDVEKMAKALTDSSLNFKYSTLEKATAVSSVYVIDIVSASFCGA
ncbi:unnamed protein product [Microthlaspi erraticum]|uniref:Gnk2-homologous domain-containing protein n=1 Tax=Microthlaspi erraticum TaxID=1685480 RepID=A0A6D2HES7_9BRAS|nr:unnamed protein product [Microthlaspi erraticum]